MLSYTCSRVVEVRIIVYLFADKSVSQSVSVSVQLTFNLVFGTRTSCFVFSNMDSTEGLHEDFGFVLRSPTRQDEGAESTSLRIILDTLESLTFGGPNLLNNQILLHHKPKHSSYTKI